MIRSGRRVGLLGGPQISARSINSGLSSISGFLMLLGVVTAAATVVAQDAPVRFARDVLPILSNKCFVCHGPDTQHKGLLRLDSIEGATADLGGYRAIDPDDLDASELIVRIQDPDDPMPPADAEKQLTAAERDVLARWVRQGGRYEPHWAFVPPRKAEPEGRALRREDAIDYFIESALAANGFQLSEPADRATLARRVALVLTGLPPEPQQLSRFLADDSEMAYEKLLDELFASPRFGEHQARYWLDAVRYGDTHGLHLDNRRGIFPYRDWVVRAFNQNLPFDQFIEWQIAGDLLPEPTLEQRLATGFVRLNPSTGEGGAIAEEFQAKNNFDRVETLGTVLLGMSLVCARCHTHKYDPIPQSEYFGLLAFFNSTAEPALDGNSYTYGDVVRVPRDQKAWDDWSALQEQKSRALDSAEAEFEAQCNCQPRWEVGPSRFHSDPMQVALIESNLESPPTVDHWQTWTQFQSDHKDIKTLTAGQSIWFRWQIESGAPQTAWLSFAGPPDARIYVNSIAANSFANHYISGRFQYIPMQLGAGEQTIEIGVTGEGTSLDPRVEAFSPVIRIGADLEKRRENWRQLGEIEKLLFLAESRSAKDDHGNDTLELVLDLRRAEAEFTTSLVARELAQRRETRLLNRGEYDLPTGAPIEPGVIRVMGDLPPNAPRNRLGLAQWLTARDHPLVARVIVNRIWQRTFGRGLVRTPEDFGLQGQQPTHPELLDWLAVEFQESGWDLKRLLRLMVTSRTFKQSSRWRPDVDDPENRLWARAQSYRLDAEVIRDMGLWASELLDPRIGGEGVKPYQPPGMWEALAHPGSNTRQYIPDSGSQLYRRSLYVYWKRTSPHPMMTLFDAPDRESSCVRRSRTNTSLQSLGLLNETQRVEMGRKFAERLLRQCDTTNSRLQMMFTLLASRPPTEREQVVCESLLARSREHFGQSVADAQALLAVGEAAADPALDSVELASWTQLCLTVLASDISITIY